MLMLAALPCCRYDVAISTACAALDYIVVESTSDAQRCVELLRRQHLGVATCLILEKQKGLAASMNERVQTPEGGSDSRAAYELKRGAHAATAGSWHWCSAHSDEHTWCLTQQQACT
jgi:hypothetical protein